MRAAGTIGSAALVRSIVPVVPFALLGVRASVIVALGLGAALLFTLGAFKTSVTAGRKTKSGAELALIGMVSQSRATSSARSSRP